MNEISKETQGNEANTLLVAGWISVLDAKPEPHSKVLAYKQNGLIIMAEWFSIDGFAFWWWGFGRWLDQTKQITHWMYLPSPPTCH